MSQEDSPNREPGRDRADVRLTRLELALADVSARLLEVERHLAASGQRAETRPFGQGSARPQEPPRESHEQRRATHDQRHAEQEPRHAEQEPRHTAQEQRHATGEQRQTTQESSRASQEPPRGARAESSGEAGGAAARGPEGGSAGAGGWRGPEQEESGGGAAQGQWAGSAWRDPAGGGQPPTPGGANEFSAGDAAESSSHAGGQSAAQSDRLFWSELASQSSSESSSQSSTGSSSQSSSQSSTGASSQSSSRGAEGWWFEGEAGEQAGAGREERAPQGPSVIERARRDLETTIGGSLFNWLGIIAVTLAVGFFLKHAFDREWIGPRGRVLLGGAAGCAILALAERLRARGYRSYAFVLSGGGVLILYLSVYAARVFYDLIGLVPAFLLMAAVTATAVALSVRYDAIAIAVLGLLGGFATPVLLSTGVDNQVGLFTYVAALDAGVLALAYFKRWRSLNYLSFVLTVLTFAGWWAQFYEARKLWPTVFFLTLFFLMFSALAVLHNVLKERPARWFDISLIITNATLYFAAAYGALYAAGYRPALGSFALAVSVFFAALFVFAFRRHRADQLLALSYAGAAVTFLTMAVAIQFDQHWVTIGWAVEGLMLTWVGLRADATAPRYAALAVFAVAAAHWFSTDLPEFAYRAAEAFVPLVNRRALSCAVLVGALGGAAHLYRRRGGRVEAGERALLVSVLLLGANALALTLLSFDVFDYFERRKGFVEAGRARRVLADTQLFSLVALWAVYGASMAAAGVARRLAAVRVAGLALLAISAASVVTTGVLFHNVAWHAPVVNQTFLGFACVVGAFAVAAYAYRRGGDRVHPDEREVLLYSLLIGANLLALIGLSLELLGNFSRAQSGVWERRELYADAGEAHRRIENTKQMALSFLWTAYALAAFVVGRRRGAKYLRYGALALLVVAGIKILSLDAPFYNAPWHAPLFNQTFAAFALFVAACWYVARAYVRDPTTGEDERRAVQLFTVAGNLFALVALSLEATGYFNKQIAAADPAGWRDLRLAQQLSLSLVWVLYGGAMLAFGHVRRNRLLRLLALGLLVVTTVKVFFFDLASLERLYRIISFVVLGAILLGVSFLYQQRQRRAAEAEAEAGG
jgi:uncharacterized membrane protein